MSERMERLAAYLALAAALAVGAWLRAVGLNMSLFGDEVTSFQRALAPAAYQIAHVDSPLITLLSHYTLRITETEIGLRLPSFLAGCLAILAIYPMATAVGGRLAGVLAAWLLALAPFHLEHSQHARYYALLILAGILWVWFLERALTRRDPFAWAAFALTTVWALLVHQFGWPFLAAFLLAAGGWISLADPLSDWTHRRRQLGALAAAAAVGCLGLLIVYSAREASPFQIASALDAAPANGGADADAPRYRLSLMEYTAFIDDLFRPAQKSVAYGALLGLFGAIGAAWLLYHRRFTGVAIVAAVLLPPLPLLLVTARYPYEVRYFSIFLPLGIVAVACGISALSRWARAHAGPHAALAQGVVAAVCVALLIPSSVGALHRYYDDHPPKDWKALHNHVAPTLEPGAVIYNLDPSGEMTWRLRTTRREFYLRRMVPAGPMLYQSLIEQVGDLTPDTLWKLASDYPESTIYFIALLGHGGEGMRTLDTYAYGLRDFGDVRLWELGAPTVNLFDQAGFEWVESHPDQNTDVGVIESDEAYHGSRYLRIRSEEMVDQFAFLPLVAGPRRVTTALRNAQFKVWRDGLPAGWRVEAGPALLAAGNGPEPESRALRIRPDAGPVRLSQPVVNGLMPGRTIRLTARALAGDADSLRVGIRYERRGAIERHSVAHPGNGKWESLTLDAVLPSDIRPESVALEVVRAGGAQHPAAVMDLGLVILGVEEPLDPLSPHVLSLMMQHDTLRSRIEDANTQHAASLRLLFKTPEGEDDSVELRRFYGTRQWHHLAFRIDPGVTIPLGARELKLQIHLYGTGTIRVDNVQLEARATPSPFTSGRRLPHDEYLVGLQPENGAASR